ncbi:Exodeoxyribonuclease I [Buchnera aphidicola (Takecallis arundicolens)]|uniref:exodeoxyribonuclease I n=1 Tax=Buchnera aphidicola TaxID=9 RepID=UPI003463B510
MKNLIENNFTFLFYDYETFGLHPALDKPSQFACIRTDVDLNIIEPHHHFFCYPPIDYLPDPKSVLLTGITPQYTKKNGLNEFFFSKKIFSILNTRNTCIVGYNNIQFDDEITRNIFYRNFLDPYSWSWKNNNSRWDLICLVRACYILTPDNIIWPKNKLGFVSFKLEDLTKTNNINHNAHDALSDVYATIEVMRFIKKKKPALFNFFFKYRLKSNIKKLINIHNYTPLIHISNYLGSMRNNITCIVPICWSNSNNLIFFDLYMDLDILINYVRVTHINKINIQKLYSFGVGFLNINKCPILIPLDFFTKKKLLTFFINMNVYLNKICILQKEYNFLKKMNNFFKKYTYSNITNNVDLKIYDSFFSQKEKNTMYKIHSIKISAWNNIQFDLNKKLQEMFFRLRARNFPILLSQLERKKWKIHCIQVFSENIVSNYFIMLKQLLDKHSTNHRLCALLVELEQYACLLMKQFYY